MQDQSPKRSQLTLTEQLLHNEEAKAAKQAEDNSNNERNRRRTTCFCIQCSNAWSKPVHSIIKSIKDKFNLQWLRVSASYHRFTNLREVFQGALFRKLTVGLTSRDFEPLPCNCRTSGNGNFGHNNMCRNSTAVYKVKCNDTGKAWIGNTQQKFKNRMQQHFNEVQKLLWSNSARNQTHTPNILQLNSMTPIRPQPTKVEEQPAASSGKAIQSVLSKLSLPKTVPCVLKKDLTFSNNPDPTHNFLSTPTTKSTVPVDTDRVSTGVQSRPPPTLMSQSMTKEPVQHTKLPHVLPGATFA